MLEEKLSEITITKTNPNSDIQVELLPISGSCDDEKGGLAYILKIGDCKLLLDCGTTFDRAWHTNYNLIDEFKDINAVLLTSPLIKRIGDLPLLYKSGIHCDYYSSNPVIHAGHLTMYDFFLNKLYSSAHELFITVEDIDRAFAHITPIKYLQSVKLKMKNENNLDDEVSICAFPSGHTLGSCIWRITARDNQIEIIYAVGINQRKQIHIDEAMLSGFYSPFLLITDSMLFSTKKIRSAEIFSRFSQMVIDTLTNDGNVLLVSDSAGCCIELFFLLGKILGGTKFAMIDVIVLSNVAHHVLNLVTGNVEWISQQVMRKLESNQTDTASLLGIHSVYSCQTKCEYEAVKSARIVITSDDGNFSYNLCKLAITDFLGDEKNLVVFTNSLLTEKQNALIKENVNSDVGFDIFSKKINTFFEASAMIAANTESFKEAKQEKNEEASIENKKNKISSIQFNVTTGQWDLYGKLITYSEILNNANNDGDRKNQLITVISFEEPEEIKGAVESVKNPVLLLNKKRTEMLKKKRINELNPLFYVDNQLIVEKIVVSKKASIVHLPLENLSDGETKIKIIQMLRPQNIITVYGDKNSSEAMEEVVKQNVGKIKTPNVFITEKNKKIELFCKSTGILNCFLYENEIRSLNIKALSGNIEFGWFEGWVDKEIVNSDMSKLVIDHEKLERRTGDQLYINNIQLDELQKLIKANNISAEFRKEGELYCANDRIFITKNSSINYEDSKNRIVISGECIPEFFLIKEIVLKTFVKV